MKKMYVAIACAIGISTLQARIIKNKKPTTIPTPTTDIVSSINKTKMPRNQWLNLLDIVQNYRTLIDAKAKLASMGPVNYSKYKGRSRMPRVQDLEKKQAALLRKTSPEALRLYNQVNDDVEQYKRGSTFVGGIAPTISQYLSKVEQAIQRKI